MCRTGRQGSEAVLALLGLAAILVLARIPARSPDRVEPIYEQKPLSFWVNQLVGTNRAAAKAAVRAIGLKGVPYLLGTAWDDTGAKAGPMIALHTLGEPALPALLAATEDPTEKVRLAAVRGLAVIAPRLEGHGPALLPALVRRLKDPSSEVRYAALLVLDRPGPKRLEAIPALIGLLNSEPEPDENTIPIQERAMHLLEGCGTEAQSAVPALTKLLADPNACLRQEAALVLWAINHNADEVVPVLARMLREPDVSSRRLAGAALDRISREIYLSPDLIASVQLEQALVEEPAGSSAAEEVQETDFDDR